MGAEPVLHATLDRGDGGEVYHAVDARHRIPHRGQVGDVAEDQRGTGSEVLALAGREVVEDAHRIAAGAECCGEMRADEAAAAGDEKGRQDRIPSLRGGAVYRSFYPA